MKLDLVFPPTAFGSFDLFRESVYAQYPNCWVGSDSMVLFFKYQNLLDGTPVTESTFKNNYANGVTWTVTLFSSPGVVFTATVDPKNPCFKKKGLNVYTLEQCLQDQLGKVSIGWETQHSSLGAFFPYPKELVEMLRPYPQTKKYEFTLESV